MLQWAQQLGALEIVQLDLERLAQRRFWRHRAMHQAMGAEVPGHQGTQVLRVARSVSYKHPGRVRRDWRTCEVGLKCLHTPYNC
jgi:hypothetical protein